MRRWAEPWVRRWWKGGGGPVGRVLDVALAPAENIFGRVVKRRTARRAGSGTRAMLPVVSVGNLTVGGTGKTPFTAWLAGRLRQAGLRPGVVLRGYGPDELALHRRWNPDVPAEAARRRLSAIARVARREADAVILDDGFQHYRVHRDVDLVLVSAEQTAVWNDHLLPRGPYRESWESLRRADAVVITHRGADEVHVAATWERVANAAPGVPTFTASLRPSGWCDLRGSPCAMPEGPVLAVASVANPEGFRKALAGVVSEIDLLAYPDHHEYTAGDWRRIVKRSGSRAIVTTEKDAVKLETLADPDHVVFVMVDEVAVADEGELLALVLDGLAA